MEKYNCRHGLPHDLKPTFENPRIKCEICVLCNKKFRWVKGFKGRIDNVNYLKEHARNYAQKRGKTKRLYYKLYRPEQTKIII